MSDDDDDLPLFARPNTPHARPGDPDTSWGAIPDNITEQARTVLQAYLGGALLLDIEAYERVGMVGHQRCSDLRAWGFIERVDKKVMPSGKRGYRCRITERGRFFMGPAPVPTDPKPLQPLAAAAAAGPGHTDRGRF